jgi:hypothetical protein
MGFHDEIEKSLPTGINLAYDNLKIVSRWQPFYYVI